MGNTRADSSKPPTLVVWLLRRTALSLLTISLGYAALVYATTASAFSQMTGAAPAEATGTAPSEALIRSTLKPGSQGSAVTELQATLKLLGYYGGRVDGVYGQSTASAVSQFQQAAGLSADGITGPATWNRLFPAIAEVPSPSPTPTATVPTPATSNPRSPSVGNGSASFPIPAGASPTPSSNTPAASPRPAVKPAPAKAAPTPAKPTAETRSAANLPTTASVALPVLKQGMKGSAVVALQERLRSLGLLQGAADGVFGAETLTAVKAAQRRFKLEPDGVVGGGTWSALLR